MGVLTCGGNLIEPSFIIGTDVRTVKEDCMAIPKRKSLAGACGIPMERNRIYVVTLDEYGVAKSYPFDSVPKKCQLPVWEPGTSGPPLHAGIRAGNIRKPVCSHHRDSERQSTRSVVGARRMVRSR